MAGLSLYEWLLLALLVVAIVLVCVGAGMYYGRRPEYPSTMTVRETAEPWQIERYHASRHAADVPGEDTQRLKGRPTRSGYGDQ
jgi:hypothetical protein